MSGVLNSSRDGNRAWNTFFGTEQSWSKVCTTYILSWMVNLLQLGRFSVKAEVLRSTKCDIFATVADYKWRFDPLVSKNMKEIYKIDRHFGIFYELNNIINSIVDATPKNQPALGGTDV